ncbi:MAG: hypothetical protein JXQ69_01750 [Paludibacteraceae bacterium]|nr:hypothetical protein [Paludibacteraceae bacterium]
MSKKTIILSFVIVIALAAIGFLAWQLYNSQQEIEQKEADLKGAEELLEYEKKQTERELQALAVEIEGYDTTIGNDSLVDLLESQKQKIQQLLEELRTVKYTNGKKISELKEELSVVRKVLMNYIRQVDSLNKVNTKLFNENKDVKVKITEVTQTNQILSKEKEQLTEVVTRASMLEADNFVVETFNNRDKKTSRLSKITTIAIGFNIAKNVTASVGEKTLFVRIIKPNGDVLSKSKANVFQYENREIPFSVRKTIEYKGERLKEIVYYKVKETLLEGDYKIEVFADSQLVGSGSFMLE